MAVTGDGTAVLNGFNRYTAFTHGGKMLTFRTCDGPERHTEVVL